MESVGCCESMGGRRGYGAAQGGRLDGVVGAPCRKSANRPFLFASPFSASASALEPLGKPLGRRESKGRKEKGRRIRLGVGGLAHGAQ